MIDNIFDAPTPGQSLTDTPGNASWEHPPEFTDVEEASEYLWQKLHEEKVLDQVISFLKNDVPIEAIARMMLFGGFVNGKWTPDLAILLAPITFDHIMAIGMKAEIPKMKLSIGDVSNNQFHREFSKFKNEKNSSVSDNKRQEKFVEKITEEFSNEPSGLMNKENI